MPAPSKPLPLVLPCVLMLVAGAGCGPASRRELGSMLQRQVTYDDMCHLQDYFDQRAAAHAAPFRADNEQQTETTREERDDHGQMRPVVVGDGTYIVADHTDRVRLLRLLRDEYSHLPEPMHLTRAEASVRLHVEWVQLGVIRRLRTDRDIELVINTETLVLPFNPCVGEYLFGAQAYGMRRNVIDAESSRARGEIPPQYVPDAGPTESTADAGATVTSDAGTPTDIVADVPSDIIAQDAPSNATADVPADVHVVHTPRRRPTP